MLLATLENAIQAGIIDSYRLKGGAAIELRFGLKARATRDIDLELPVTIDRLADVFKASISIGCEDFTFSIDEEPRTIRDEALRVTTTMRYLGRGWATLDIDLAPSSPGDFVDSIPVTNREFPAISTNARTATIAFIIAQKIHAATTPDPPGYELDYARHVVDVLFLSEAGFDIASVRAACHAVFATRSVRDGRSWPRSNCRSGGLPTTMQHSIATACRCPPPT